MWVPVVLGLILCAFQECATEQVSTARALTEKRLQAVAGQYFDEMTMNKLQVQSSAPASGEKKDRLPGKFETVPTSEPFISVFETYMLKNRVFKTDSLMAASDPKDIYAVQNPQPSVVPLTNTSAADHSLPVITASNYFRRFPKDEESHLSVVGGKYASCLHRPCLVNVDALQTHVLQCPIGAHILLWGPQIVRGGDDSRTSSSSAEVAVKLFEDRSLSKFASHVDSKFIPSDHDERVGSWTVDVDYSLGDSVPTPALQDTIRGRELLFVPRSFVVTLSTSDNMPQYDKTAGDFLSMQMLCQVDASNVNVMRKQLQGLSAISEAHRRVLRVWQSPYFDLTMLKTLPESWTVGQYFSTAATIASGGDTASNDAEESAPAAAASTTTNRRDRRSKRGGGKDFKSWQNNMQWKSLIDGLVVNPPSAMQVGVVGRSNVTVHWTHNIVVAEDDRSIRGFKLQLCQHRADAEPMVLVDDLVYLKQNQQQQLELHTLPSLPMSSDAPPSTRVVCEERTLSVDSHTLSMPKTTLVEAPASLARRLRISAGGDDSGSEDTRAQVMEEVQSYTLTVEGLSPSTEYQLRIAAFYGAYTGVYTTWTPLVTTLPVTAPSDPQLPAVFASHILINPTAADMQWLSPQRTPSPRFLWTRIQSIQQQPPKQRANIKDELSYQAEVIVGRSVDDGGVPVLGYVVEQCALSRDVVILAQRGSDGTSATSTVSGEEDVWNSWLEEEASWVEGVLDDVAVGARSLDRHRSGATAQSSTTTTSAVREKVSCWRNIGAHSASNIITQDPKRPDQAHLQSDSGLRRVTLYNLQPGFFYSFRVAAYNQQGLSSWSRRSNFVSASVLSSRTVNVTTVGVNALALAVDKQFYAMPSSGQWIHTWLSPALLRTLHSSAESTHGSSDSAVPLPRPVVYACCHPLAVGRQSGEHAELWLAHASESATAATVVDPYLHTLLQHQQTAVQAYQTAWLSVLTKNASAGMTEQEVLRRQLLPRLTYKHRSMRLSMRHHHLRVEDTDAPPVLPTLSSAAASSQAMLTSVAVATQDVWIAHWTLFDMTGVHRKRDLDWELVDVVAGVCAIRHTRRLHVEPVADQHVSLHAGVSDVDESTRQVEERWEDHYEPDSTELGSDDTCQERIAFIPRGSAPLYQLARHAQRLGAVAAVIYDVSGQCVHYDQRCLPGASRHHDEGFAAQDVASYWKDVHIPVAFVLRPGFESLKAHMRKDVQGNTNASESGNRQRDEL